MRTDLRDLGRRISPSRILNRWINNAKDYAYANEILSQTITMPGFPPTALDYDIIFFGDHEFYAPSESVRAQYKDYKVLRYYALPQVIPPSYFYTIDNAIIRGRDVFDPCNEGRIVMEMYPFVSIPSGRKSWHTLPRERVDISGNLDQLPEIPQSAFIFSSLPHNNFYHFIVDSCARFCLLRDKGVISNETHLLFLADPNVWQEQYLDLIGVDLSSSTVLARFDDAPVRVRRLLVASPTRTGYVCSKAALDCFRSTIFSRIELTPQSTGRKIYVSRGDAGERRVTNETDVEGFLRQTGFEIVQLGNMPVRDQIELFAGSDTIVAPHGAGLTNMIYAPAGARVIEFFPMDGWDLGYYIALANVLGHRHIPIVCGPRQEHMRSPMDTRNKARDFDVDIPALERALQIGTP